MERNPRKGNRPPQESWRHWLGRHKVALGTGAAAAVGVTGAALFGNCEPQSRVEPTATVRSAESLGIPKPTFLASPTAEPRQIFPHTPLPQREISPIPTQSEKSDIDVIKDTITALKIQPDPVFTAKMADLREKQKKAQGAETLLLLVDIVKTMDSSNNPIFKDTVIAMQRNQIRTIIVDEVFSADGKTQKSSSMAFITQGSVMTPILHLSLLEMKRGKLQDPMAMMLEIVSTATEMNYLLDHPLTQQQTTPDKKLAAIDRIRRIPDETQKRSSRAETAVVQAYLLYLGNTQEFRTDDAMYRDFNGWLKKFIECGRENNSCWQISVAQKNRQLQ